MGINRRMHWVKKTTIRYLGVSEIGVCAPKWPLTVRANDDNPLDLGVPNFQTHAYQYWQELNSLRPRLHVEPKDADYSFGTCVCENLATIGCWMLWFQFVSASFWKGNHNYWLDDFCRCGFAGTNSSGSSSVFPFSEDTVVNVIPKFQLIIIIFPSFQLIIHVFSTFSREGWEKQEDSLGCTKILGLAVASASNVGEMAEMGANPIRTGHQSGFGRIFGSDRNPGWLVKI